MSERRKTRKRKRIEYVIGIGFLICVFGIGIINLLLPSKKNLRRGKPRITAKAGAFSQRGYFRELYGSV